MDGLLKDAGEGSIGSGGSKSRSVAALDVVLLGRENDRVSVVERVSDEAAACVATVPKDRIDVPATPEAIVPTSGNRATYVKSPQRAKVGALSSFLPPSLDR